MRIRIASLAIVSALTAACHSVQPIPVVPHPMLFPAGGLYELSNSKGQPTGYVFAETHADMRTQTLRWLLFANFKSPTLEAMYVARAGDKGGLPTTAAGLAEMARDMMDSGAHAIYVKSYAETFSEMYTPPDAATKESIRIPKIPVPPTRRPPDPPGSPRPDSWLEDAVRSGRGAPLQDDGGSVGIRPGTPIPTNPVPPAGPGYFDPASQMPVGLIGVGFAGPLRESNVEYVFLSHLLFDKGLDQTVMGPFQSPTMPMDGPQLGAWALVVVNSSYYPGYVPNQW